MIPIKPEDLLKMLRGHLEKEVSVGSHYGVKDEDMLQWTKEMLCDIIMHEKKSTTIDKWFPNLKQEDRCKVICYASALIKHENMR